jgi:hypothetical protein
VNRPLLILAAALSLTAAASAALAQRPAPAPASRTANLQGGDTEKFMNNDYIRRFYAL